MVNIKYLYKASNRAGQTVEGVIEAADKNAVVGALRAKALYLLDLSDANPKTSMDITIGSAKIPKKVLSVFCMQFASILKAGVPLVQALSIMTEQLEDKKLKKIIEAVNDDLQRGRSLSDAFAAHERALPNIFIKMIEAGEMSGTLDISLQRLSTHFEKEYNITKKIKGAMMYPIIVSIVALLVITFLLIFIVPKFTSIFTNMGAALPPITAFVLSVSSFITNDWYYILIFTAIIIALFKLYKSSPAGRLQLDTIKLKIPVLGKANTRIMTSRLCRTLSTLTSAGVSLTQSLHICSKVVTNKLAEIKLLDIEDQIKQGRSLHLAIKSAAIFPNMLMHMTKIGEESGMLDEMLEKASIYFEEEADTAITKLTTLLQPIMLVIVAVLVLFIILAVITPMFGIYSIVGG